MKTLDQLIRLHRHRLHDKQKALTRLEAEAAELKLKAEMLEAEALVESARAEESHFPMVSFAPYFERVKERRFAFADARGALHSRVLAARDDLKLAFQALKRIEILREKKQGELTAAEKKQDQAALDEVALQQHRRGSA